MNAVLMPGLILLAQLGAGGLTQDAYLKAPNGQAEDRFGQTLAVAPGLIMVAAPLEDSDRFGGVITLTDNSASSSGIVYVFKPELGTWQYSQSLKYEDPDEEDQFGFSMAARGEVLVVGVPLEDSVVAGGLVDPTDNSRPDSGAACVYRLTNGLWQLESILKAPNSNMGDFFGGAVGVDGDRIVVGAGGEDGMGAGIGADPLDNSYPNAGAAYVYEFSQGAWQFREYLKAPNPDAGDAFGSDVAISGNVIALGVPVEDSPASGINPADNGNLSLDVGAVYIFTLNPQTSTWSFDSYIKASNAEDRDRFGDSIALEGPLLLVGAPGEDGSSQGVNGNQADNFFPSAGAAYLYSQTSTGWTQTAYIKPLNTTPLMGFGTSVAICGPFLAVGAPSDRGGTGGIDPIDGALMHASGAAFVFEPAASLYVQRHRIKASNPGNGDGFTLGLSFADGVLVAGARGESSASVIVNGDQDNDHSAQSGAAYVFSSIGDEIGQPFCMGSDGSSSPCTTCPCLNALLPGGTGGCGNSTGSGGELFATGSANVSIPYLSLSLAARQLPNHTWAILTSGSHLLPSNPANSCTFTDPGAGVPFSGTNGLRCVGGAIRRHGGRVSDGSGAIGLTTPGWVNPIISNGTMQGAQSGQTFYFQLLYRDLPHQSCVHALNTTNAWGVTFN